MNFHALVEADTHLDDSVPLEQVLTYQRFSKLQERTIANFGNSSSVSGKALTEAFLPRLTTAFTEALAEKVDGRRRVEAEVHRLLRDVPPEVIALCALQAVIDAVATSAPRASTTAVVGRELWWESWSQALLAEDRKGISKLIKQVQSNASNLSVRRTAFRALARKRGFTGKQWDVRTRHTVGLWALEVLLQTLPDAFELIECERRGAEYVYGIAVLPEAWEMACEAYERAMTKRAVFLPSLDAPRAWTSCGDGGPADPRMQAFTQLVRTHREGTVKRVNASIRNGKMQPALDAINAIQATPWVINTRLLDVIEQLRLRKIDVPGIPRVKDFEIPAHPGDTADKLDKDLWRYKARKSREANRTLAADRLGFHRDLTVARALRDEPRFYTPWNMDFRGRVYPLPFFNFQRSDMVRALHLLAEGEALGVDGLYWLMVHTANCGDFDKVSKRSFEERVQWTEDNAAVIREIAENPLAEAPLAKWSAADQPFLFLAACIELNAALQALAAGYDYVSRLPCSWDGACNGLQHLCAMTRAPEGELVNLTPQKQPADVYQTVADAVAISVMEDAAGYGPDVANAKDWLEHGVGRGDVKRNVMTYAYSSKKFGMAEQQREDCMKPLELKVLEGELEEHPFGPDNGMSASVYIAGKVHAAIEQVVRRPAEAMGFLQQLAKIMANENKPLRWLTPAGLPWENRYHEPIVETLKLFLRNNGVQTEMNIATGQRASIAKDKAANAVAPNFVHACDASHLLLTVNAAVAEGITSFGLVHDSFGCLASRAGDMHRIIRETFVRMYEEHDVLQEALESAKADLTDPKALEGLTPPQAGSLNIRELLNARYAFA